MLHVVNYFTTYFVKPRLTTDTPSKVTSTNISELRDAKSPQTQSQWSDSLLSLLLQRHPPQPTTSPTDNNEKIELVASLPPSSTELNLIIRKNISGITQRLGSLTLPYDDDEVLDTLHWTSIAIARATSLDQEVAALTANYTAAEKTVASLTKQLDDLVAAKQAHETALLGKCMELLNQKKAKIRDQQRLLAGATVDRRCGERIRDGAFRRLAKGRPRVRAEEGGKKRKAEDAALEEDEDDDDAFESPSSPKVKKEEGIEGGEDEEMDDGRETPEAEDDEDITEDGGGAGALDGRMHVDKTSPAATRDLPPDRDLPFGKEASRPPPISGQQEAGNEDVETDDDDDDEL